MKPSFRGLRHRWRHRGPWLRGRRLYGSLLAVSFLVQLVWPDPTAPLAPPRSPPPHYWATRVPMMSDTGPHPSGRTIRVASVLIDRPAQPHGEQVLSTAPADLPIVFLHGSPGRAEDGRWLGTILTERGRRTIAVDLPGFGDSSRWIADYSIAAQARSVLVLMEQRGIDRAHLFAHSMGAGVAYHLADLVPGRVASITSYGGIGIQEGEGSGDYHFEHFKYALGYAAFVVGPELLPHFGLLGARSLRHSWIRNFLDTDQRPVRALLARLRTPVLLLHGRDDPLVPYQTAIAHHGLIADSDLVLMDQSHFMVFSRNGAEELAWHLLPFLHEVEAGRPPGTRRTIDLTRPRPPEARLPVELDLDRLGPWTQMLAIALATYVSEDLTCVAVGLLIGRHELDLFVGLVGCWLGIYLGDLLLWLIGRWFGRPLLRWGWVRRRLPVQRIEMLGEWFDRHGWAAIVASRFMPGTRLPLYLAAGMVGRRARVFVVWSFIAVSIWTPLMVLLSAWLGDRILTPMHWLLGSAWLAVPATVAVVFLGIRLATLAATFEGRARLIAGLSRLWRWEFWPAWLFHIPTTLWFILLALRHRSWTVFTAANPAMPHGGVVGESKSAILSKLPPEWVIPFGTAGDATEARSLIRQRSWAFPLILKPDAAQRGAGLKLVRDDARLDDYFTSARGPILVQPYHPGPFEAGVFYYRFPDQPRGRIYSVTDKHFAQVVGDGRSTLRRLILQHRRYRMQSGTFLRRLADRLDGVPAEGERVGLGLAGNHCQGTLFRDGSHLITPQLEDRIDRIARSYDGFFFGRFDIRYRSADELRRGEGLAIVELNGVSSESTNIYDPNWSIIRAYRVLFGQWTLAFGIGAMNRSRGCRVTGTIELLREVRRYYRGRRVELLSD